MARRVDIALSPTSPFKPTGAARRLVALAGRFQGPVLTWFDPAGEPERATMRAIATPVLGGRWLRLEYESEAMGDPHAGQLVLGIEPDLGELQASWIDSFHSPRAIMPLTGPVPAAKAPFSVRGSYAAGDQRWGWRIALAPVRGGGLALRMFNAPPGLPEVPAVEALLAPAR